jgi:hypothetical protein
VVSGTSLEPTTVFLLAFDRQTLELVALEWYPTRDAAIRALIRHDRDEGHLATAVGAESEVAVRATHDLEEIAGELRASA